MVAQTTCHPLVILGRNWHTRAGTAVTAAFAVRSATKDVVLVHEARDRHHRSSVRRIAGPRQGVCGARPGAGPWAELRCAAHLLVLGAICLIAVAAMMDLAAGRNVLSIDVTVGRWLQREPIPFGSTIAAFGNAAGSTGVGVPVSLVAAALLAIARRWTDVVFLLGLLLARGLNALLKEMASSPRPSGSLLHVSEFARGFGFPSGHSMGAVLLAGGLAYVAWAALPGRRIRVVPSLIAIIVVLATGYGRVDTGAHWPTDVLGGFFAGGFILLLGILVRRLAISHQSFRAAGIDAIGAADTVRS